jgi:hypothetical protein
LRQIEEIVPPPHAFYLQKFSGHSIEIGLSFHLHRIPAGVAKLSGQDETE